MPSEGLTTQHLIKELKELASFSTNWGSPRFMGFPDAGNGMPALGAAVLGCSLVEATTWLCGTRQVLELQPDWWNPDSWGLFVEYYSIDGSTGVRLPRLGDERSQHFLGQHTRACAGRN